MSELPADQPESTATPESNGEIAEIKPAEVIPVAEVTQTAEQVPVVALPASPRIEPFSCPECGIPQKNEQALVAHVRFKHTLPRKRREAAALKAGKAPSTPPPAPPDFSDIGGPGQSAAAMPEPSVVPADARYETMAAMTFDMSTGLLARVFGPEWMPQPDQGEKPIAEGGISHERMTMVAAIKKYYQSVNMPDLPPGYLLAFCCLAYAAPRLSAQPTKTKLQQIYLWIKTKFQRKKKV